MDTYLYVKTDVRIRLAQHERFTDHNVDGLPFQATGLFLTLDWQDNSIQVTTSGVAITRTGRTGVTERSRTRSLSDFYTAHPFQNIAEQAWKAAAALLELNALRKRLAAELGEKGED